MRLDIIKQEEHHQMLGQDKMQKDVDLAISPTQHIRQRLMSNGDCDSLGFPFQSYSASRHQFPCAVSPHWTQLKFSGLLRKICALPKVYASDSVKNPPAVNNSMKEASAKSSNKVDTEAGDNTALATIQNTLALEHLARSYIENETGMERVRMMYKKDYKGEASPDLQYVKVVLVQTFLITFLLKYVPSFRNAKQEFIKEHRSTVFRTRMEAARRMQDQVSLRALLEGVSFASKVTIFSAGFLFTAQTISCYRNKTSFIEYTIAAGITGGLARLQLGPKGFIAGSFVGLTLGTLVGGLAYVMLNSFGITQEARHLQDIMSKLEVERHLVGEDDFKQRVQELKGAVHSPT